ncbi:MAG: cytosine permease [Kiritimatiellae bacterium]|nr:cytosine permease [Kiritimatiellia bacterium]MDD5522123.1 cytosine permease [Kiritimatiellia bacterium]
MSNGTLPSYLSMAKPNPSTNRAPWYKNTAPTYAGIFLWFVFWSQAPSGGSGVPGGVLSQGVGVALLGLVVAALLCHFLFYYVPGLLGLKTGLPLYVVGTSTYGTQGGFLMPGFLMGVLQFGWLGVNAFFSAQALSPLVGGNPMAVKVLMVLWAALAAFVGLKGIQYVAKVATYLPLIPVAILVILLAKTLGGIGSFDAQKFVGAAAAGGQGGGLSFLGVMALSMTFVIGFFATAGAAGVDFGTNSKDEKDVQMGGLMGIALAAIVSAGAAILIAAGAFGKTGTYAMNPADTAFMGNIMGSAGAGKTMGLLLAIAAFPSACFSSFIAANSFKTTMPKINPFITVGLGAIVSIILAVTGLAGKAGAVFTVIGASFGPICGAMMVDYLLSGGKWSGPRKGWNMAGWISWAVGFVVGIAPLVNIANIPAAPLVAFIVGAVLYFVLAKAGLQPEVVPLPSGDKV